MAEILAPILWVALILIFYFIYKKFLPKYLDNQISEKKEILNNLKLEIDSKKSLLEKYNQNDLTNMNTKIDILLHKDKDNPVTVLALLIIICTAIIMYFLYKWTYVIQPEHIKEFFNTTTNNLTDSIFDLFQ